MEFSDGKHYYPYNTSTLLIFVFTLIFLSSIPLCLLENSWAPLLSASKLSASESRIKEMEKQCDVFTGRWIPYPEGPYYTNTTCNLIIDQQNCMKFGRLDTEFLKWRWKPHACELPLFDAKQFLELVRGKSLAFVGDSVGRNQMQSLLCLLVGVASVEDISQNFTSDTINFKKWFYPEYNFTVANLWSPFLVKSREADPNGYSVNSFMKLYLDEADEAWTSKVEDFDYAIISAGQWFFRPLLYQQNGSTFGCHICNVENVTALTVYDGYRLAFRTAFKAIQSLKNYTGITFLRTYSPSHFENGDWNKGGNCVRTRPFAKEELKDVWYSMEMYRTQVEEFRRAEEEGKKKGFEFRLLSTTEAMLMRPDGHPNHFGRSRHKNVTLNDCVHWCLPGPVETWNEFLLYMLKKEEQSRLQGRLMKNSR